MEDAFVSVSKECVFQRFDGETVALPTPSKPAEEAKNWKRVSYTNCVSELETVVQQEGTVSSPAPFFLIIEDVSALETETRCISSVLRSLRSSIETLFPVILAFWSFHIALLHCFMSSLWTGRRSLFCSCYRLSIIHSITNWCTPVMFNSC